MGAGSRGRPGWLFRIEMLGTTAVVLLIVGMVLWLRTETPDPHAVGAISTALLGYAGGVLGFGRQAGRQADRRIPWWPFVAAGVCAASAAELINAELLLTRELAFAAMTGVVIGLAHWTALRAWLHLTDAPPA